MRTADILDLAAHTMMAAPGFCDEVAMCFGREDDLTRFVEEAKKRFGVEHFNSVSADLMRRQDAGGEFTVRFEFLRLPERHWRIEAMCVLGGKAPLHEQALNTLGSPVPIHVSYKCESLDRYQEEVRKMREEWGQMQAEYMNSYGMFSYFRKTPYLKPRVNLRDQ